MIWRESQRERDGIRWRVRVRERERQRIGFQESLMLDPGSIKWCNVLAHQNNCGYAAALIENQSCISCRHSLSGYSVPIYTGACMSHKQTYLHTQAHRHRHRHRHTPGCVVDQGLRVVLGEVVGLELFAVGAAGPGLLRGRTWEQRKT